MRRAMKGAGILLALMMICVLLTGCPGFTPAPGEPELTPLEKAQQTATWMEETYTAQRQDYEYMVRQPNLTEAQKDVLRIKYKFLLEAEPLIRTYRDSVKQGLVPSPELEAQINRLLTRLQTMATQ